MKIRDGAVCMSKKANPGSRDLATGQVETSDVQVETGCTGRVSALSTNQHSEAHSNFDNFHIFPCFKRNCIRFWPIIDGNIGFFPLSIKVD